MQKQLDQQKWQVSLIRSGMPGLNQLPDRLGIPELRKLPWLFQPVRPADIGEGLREAMLKRANMLEDVNYQKIVPNRFIIEVSQNIFSSYYRPIERQIIQQWTEHLLEELITANSRQGRKEFRFGGGLKLDVKPANDLRDSEARILCRVEQESTVRYPVPVPQGPNNPPAEPPVAPVTSEKIEKKPSVKPEFSETIGNIIEEKANITSAFLEITGKKQRWALYPGVTTIGRSELCQIFLEDSVVQEKRLVSGQHAYIVMNNKQCLLFDGSPEGRPSANGTFVNFKRVSAGGYPLKEGDAILLAAVDQNSPRSDTPGVITLVFRLGPERG